MECKKSQDASGVNYSGKVDEEMSLKPLPGYGATPTSPASVNKK